MGQCISWNHNNHNNKKKKNEVHSSQNNSTINSLKIPYKYHIKKIYWKAMTPISQLKLKLKAIVNVWKHLSVIKHFWDMYYLCMQLLPYCFVYSWITESCHLWIDTQQIYIVYIGRDVSKESPGVYWFSLCGARLIYTALVSPVGLLHLVMASCRITFYCFSAYIDCMGWVWRRLLHPISPLLVS